MPLTHEEFRQVGAVVANWKKPLLLTHERSDGDALGSMIAMRSIFQSLGAKPKAVTFEPPQPGYAFMLQDEPLLVLNRDIRLDDFDDVDGVLILDTCTYGQLSPAADWLRSTRVQKIALDHHVTRDDLADIYIVDEEASAACAIVYDWAVACRQELDSTAVRSLFVGIATDTGWFRFSNCNAHALEIAADLVRRGVSPESVYRHLYETDPVERLRLVGVALNAMEIHCDERLALLPISQEMFRQAGATPDQTEGIVNEPFKIESVQTSVLLADAGDGVIKCSFRSKGAVDVAELAGRFGGGGHRKAAGARIAGTLDEVKAKILAQLET